MGVKLAIDKVFFTWYFNDYRAEKRPFFIGRNMPLFVEVADPVFVERAVKGLSGDCRNSEMVSKVILRTSPWKARWQQNLFHGLAESVEVVPSDWNEDEHGNERVFPAAIAAQKAVNRKDDLDLGTIGFSTDTGLSDGVRPINKPLSTSSADDIRTGLIALIGEEGDTRTRRFFVNCGIAFFEGVQGDGMGLNATERHCFDFQGLSISEADRYLSGFSVDELRQTNGGIRWPHDLIQSHIFAVDGVGRDAPDFEAKLTGLFLSLIGAPLQARKLLLDFNLILSQPGGSLPADGSFYRNMLEGNWTYLFHLNSNESAIAKSVSAGDCTDISQMMEDNFTFSYSFQSLSSDARRLYIEANVPLEVWQTVIHPDNILAIVVKDTMGKVIGYQVVRMKTDENGVSFGNLRRLHVARGKQKTGLGGQMMILAEEFTVTHGGSYLQIPASGGSESFFSAMGYQRLTDDNPLGTKNPELAQRGADTPLIQLVKQL